MLRKARTTALTLALAAMAAAPTAALAKHGADDPSGDDRGGQLEAGDDRGGQLEAGDDHGGRGADGGADRGKRVAGTCDGSSTAKLKVEPDDGRLEVELEVDQNRNGVTWSVRVRRDGVLVVRRDATTHGPSGSFSVEKKIGNPAGSDRVTARATSPGGEVCTAALTI